MTYDDKPAISTGLIITFFILFFPIAFILILVRVAKHRNFSYQRLMDRRNFGLTLLFFGCIMVIMMIASIQGQETVEPSVVPTMLFTIFLFFGLPALIVLMPVSRKLRELNQRYDTYRYFIIEEGIGSLQRISELNGQRVEIVYNDLLRMMYYGMLDPSSYLDWETKTIRLPEPYSPGGSSSIIINGGGSSQVEVNVSVNASGDLFADETVRTSVNAGGRLLPVTVECDGCGAKSVLKPGEARHCEYCDTPLVYPPNAS